MIYGDGEESSGLFVRSEIGGAAGGKLMTTGGTTPRQSEHFARKLKALRKSYGSKAQMRGVKTPRGVEEALEEIFIFYSYKWQGA